MIVSRTNVYDIIREIRSKPYFSLDLETTGLFPYKGDSLFSMAISTDTEDYYFNFNGLSSINNAMILRHYVLQWSDLTTLLQDYKGIIFMHNAKFDMAFLAKEIFRFDITKLDIHCTYAMERIIHNDRISYGLDHLGKEIFGIPKDKKVKKYVTKRKLFHWVTIKGKKKREKKMFYDLVPLDLMMPYALQDSRLTYMLGIRQLFKLSAQEQKLYRNEKRLTHTLYNMEEVGVKIDKEYTTKAQNASLSSAFAHSEEFTRLTMLDYLDSSKVYERAFSGLRMDYPKTDKGNPSFNDDFLSSLDHPVAKAILGYRTMNKKCGTYFSNFLYLADDSQIIRCNFKQGGTASGRLSCSNPNLQNVNKTKDEGDYPVRACFVPREGYFFAMLDYNQMEYRMMLDYAGQLDLIQEINSGLDVHEATAKLMGVERDVAKTINFMLLYGGGTYKLAKSLNISLAKASYLRHEYFRKLPRIKRFIDNVISAVEDRGYVMNWLKRRCRFDKDSAYKAPNYLIQGGCADVVKACMNIIDEFLKNYKSNMIMTIHDEIVFEIHESEDWIVDYLKEIMETTYPHEHIPLTVGVETSRKSWKDKDE